MQYIPVNPFPMFICLINLFPWLPRKTYNGKIDHSEKNRNHFVRPRKWACPWAWNVSFYSWIMISIRLGSYDSETLEVIYDEQKWLSTVKIVLMLRLWIVEWKKKNKKTNRDPADRYEWRICGWKSRGAAISIGHIGMCHPKRYHCRALLVWRLKVQPFALKWGTCSVGLVISQIYYKYAPPPDKIGFRRREVTRMFGSSSP